ncbi:MAG: pseudouridine synthase [Eubacterium sp.]|nr:pseudouridine synthase [Eubacterium sp.]
MKDDNNKSEAVRINKFLSEAGVLSRRKADEAVSSGEVLINGIPAELGSVVNPGDKVEYKGVPVSAGKKDKIIILNKPLGLVCTAKEADKDSIFRKIDFHERLIYVGRLDKDSQGLLLLTTDGDLANSIQKSRNNHEKEYVVRVDKDITEDFLKGMRGGVPILDTVTKKCKVVKQGNRSFRIIITQGLNRQIRRMCEYFGYRVVFLKRIRELNILLGDLKPGEYRELTKEEETELRRLVDKPV